MTVIHEANPSVVSKGVANVEKMELLGRIISDFDMCKSTSYTLTAIPALQVRIPDLTKASATHSHAEIHRQL
jgi:hypothetical protein